MAYYRGLNINIRCIEINIARAKAIEQEKLNINIRCIEIRLSIRSYVMKQD